MPPPTAVPQPKLRGQLRQEDSPEVYNQISALVFAYMDATQGGKPTSLTQFCTSQLGIWYGRKGFTIQQAEADIAGYYRIWPDQFSSFDQADLQIWRTDHDDWYFVTLPFEWQAKNKIKRESGRSILNAAIVLTPDGYRGSTAFGTKRCDKFNRASTAPETGGRLPTRESRPLVLIASQSQEEPVDVLRWRS
jgi:hypothetical protein